MESNEQSILNCFDGVWRSIRAKSEYSTLPPRGPPDHLPALSNKELESISMILDGKLLRADKDFLGYSYDKIQIFEDNPAPVDVPSPVEDDLDNVNICAIDGSNQKINHISFFILLARATILNFKYSRGGLKPLFYIKNRDATGVVQVDGNIFSKDIELYTDVLKKDRDSNELPILPKIMRDDGKPLLTKYDPSLNNKNPASHALGWAVKLQQALELACLVDVPEDTETVCIRDGPLFSTSVCVEDTIEGLSKTFAWNKKILVSVAKRVNDSKLLAEALLLNESLRNYWFPEQNINDDTLKSVATDFLLLPKILKPGQRTPLMVAVPRARTDIVEQKERLTPLVCYYMRRIKPHTVIRLEIPKFFWDRDKEKVLKAIKLVAWQHELGYKAPLVQVAVDERCQIGAEKIILENQRGAALSKSGIDFPEVYE